VVLRSTNDLRVWKAVLLRLFICDALHLYATWLTLGSLFLGPGSVEGRELDEYREHDSVWGCENGISDGSGVG